MSIFSILPSFGIGGAIKDALIEGEVNAKEAGIKRANDERQQAILKRFKEGRNQDLAEGRQRGQELFGQGTLGTRAQPAISNDLQDVLNRRRSALAGFSSPEQAAMRAQALGQIGREGQTQLRSLRGQQAASGVRGATAGAQQMALQKNLQKQQAETERDLFLQNLAERNNNLGAFEKTLGEEQNRAEREKLGQISTEMGFGQLGAAERAAAAQQAIGEQQAQAARMQGAKSEGKK